MLILSRKESERILIGDDIVVTIAKIKGKTVRVGIEAPPDVRLLRGELEGRSPEGVENVPDAVNTGAPNYIGHAEEPG